MSRKIDALIAEHVMGTDVQKSNLEGVWAPDPDYPDQDWDYFVGDTSERLPKYSTDIDAAFEIVRKLKNEALLNLSLVGAMYTDEYQAKFGGHLRSDWEKTAPMAICKAALAAEGIPYE